MQLTWFAVILTATSLVKAQIWTDPSSGVTMKAMYVPLRKGGATNFNLPDFSKMKPLNIINLTSLPLSVSDLQQAPSQNQIFRPKENSYESIVHPLQDVRLKQNSQPFKPEFPNYNAQNVYTNPNFQEQNNHVQYPPAQNAQNYQITSHQQFNQPDAAIVYGNSHLHRNVTPLQQQQSNNVPSGNYNVQNIQQNSVVNKGQSFYNPVSMGHQAYEPEDVLSQKAQTSNSAYSHQQNFQQNLQHHSQSYGDRGAVQDTKPHQNVEKTFSGEQPRYFPQPSSDSSEAQHHHMNSQRENLPYLNSHHQANYAVQNSPNTQHLDPAIRHTNPFQGFHMQEKRNQHIEQPVNTYAVVHQRVPADNFGTQSNRGNMQSEQGLVAHYKQINETRMQSPHGGYMNHESADYIQTNANQEALPPQVTSSNHMKTDGAQNYADNSQYTFKQFPSGNVNNYQFNGNHQAQASPTQFMMPQHSQHSQSQSSPSDGQYFHPQMGSPVGSEIRNQEGKNSHPQNTGSQRQYPDPSSETFYPENKQIYLSAPPKYSSQVLQQQPTNEHKFVSYSSPMEANFQSTQLPFAIQNGQVGIHLSLPNKNYGH